MSNVRDRLGIASSDEGKSDPMDGGSIPILLESIDGSVLDERDFDKRGKTGCDSFKISRTASSARESK